jgi:serine protease Do
MLGVSFGPERTCRVSRVEPGSAAHKAGIQSGDVILKYDGESLSNFDRLVEITGSHKPGDAVSLEVLRGDTKLNVVAQLTGWGLEIPSEPKK